MAEKKIELCQIKAGDIKTGFGNPRKIGKKRLEELEKSFEMLPRVAWRAKRPATSAST